MFKDNGTRPITRASINSRSQMRSKKDRKDWDDRFSIERMPEYNALKDRHWQAYINMIKKKFKKTKRIQPQVEMAPGRIRIREIKQPDKGSVERNGSRPTGSRPPKAGIGKNRNAITDEVIEILKEDLIRIWDEFWIPQYHKDVFSRSLQHLSTDSAAVMISSSFAAYETYCKKGYNLPKELQSNQNKIFVVAFCSKTLIMDDYIRHIANNRIQDE